MLRLKLQFSLSLQDVSALGKKSMRFRIVLPVLKNKKN